MKTKIPTRFRFEVVSFELVDDPAIVAAAAPGEQPWRAVLIEEGVRTTDRRMVSPNALSWRDLPLTLGYQGTTPSGFNPHGDAIASGRIETIERTPGPGEGTFRLLATGAFTADDDGRRAAEAVRSQKVRGISADVEAIEVRYDAEIDAETGDVISETEVLDEGRIMGAIVTPHPAFADAIIEVDGEVVENVEDEVVEEEVEVDDEAIAAAARPGIDSSYFEDLNLDRLTPFTVEPIPGVEGTFEVFGHIAPRNVCHVGLPGCRTVPLSTSGYAYFHTKAFETTDLGKIHVGLITLGGLHTDLRDLADRDEFELRRSFEDMDSVACFVRAGHDSFGIWVHGVTKAGMTTEEVELLTASNPSGEWKPIRGSSELIRVHNVPVPGFPVPRTLVASALYRNGEQVAFRSAGVPREPECEEEPLAASGFAQTDNPFIVELHGLSHELLVRLERVERAQAAMARFGTFTLPEKL
jgi:hypothetical protein